MEKGYIAVAEVASPHGLEGEVRVIPLTDFPERLQPPRRVLLGEDGGEVTILQSRLQGKARLLRLSGITDRSAAEELRGRRLFVRSEELPPLPEGQYYLFQIVGLTVFTAGGQRLGRVKDVLKTGSNDVYVVLDERRPGARDLYVPAIRDAIADIDLGQGSLTLRDLPGLLD